MADEIWVAIIETVPAVLWVVFAAVVYLTLRRTIVQRMVPRMTTLRALGVEVELASELLDRAQRNSPEPVGEQTRRRALGRLEHAADVLRGGRVLWVDDWPQNNVPLVELLGAVGMTVDLAESTREALSRLRERSYDIIISDIARGEDEQAGIRMLRDLERRHVATPVVLFSGEFDPTRGVDPRIFAVTTQPVELIHYVVDLMERARFGLPGA